MFFETSYSAGIYINEYIHGNEIYPLREFITSYQGTMFGSLDFEDFLTNLQKYNKRAKHKINFVGIDLEYQKEITLKMLEYCRQNKMKSEFETILNNQKETISLQNLTDSDYEKKREKLLIKHFLVRYQKQIEVLCFMGAWHVRDNSKEVNFVKEIRKEKLKLLSLEVLYQDSKRTTKQNDKFKIVKVNDKINMDDYHIYYGIGISKANSKLGMILLKDCNALKMI